METEAPSESAGCRPLSFANRRDNKPGSLIRTCVHISKAVRITPLSLLKQRALPTANNYQPTLHSDNKVSYLNKHPPWGANGLAAPFNFIHT